MDVEQIQKINEMALNLLRQGLAQDRADAVVQAERFFKKQDSSDYSSMRKTLDEVQQDRQPQQAAVVTQVDLSQDKIKEILEQNASFIVKKFKEFQERVDSMEKEMSSLRAKVDNARMAAVEQPAARSQSQSAQQQTQARGMPSSGGGSGGNAAPVHPRSGNYSESDVSIEKFFYMGHKK